LFYQL